MSQAGFGLADTFATRAMLHAGLESWRLVERGRWLLTVCMWRIRQ